MWLRRLNSQIFLNLHMRATEYIVFFFLKPSLPHMDGLTLLQSYFDPWNWHWGSSDAKVACSGSHMPWTLLGLGFQNTGDAHSVLQGRTHLCTFFSLFLLCQAIKDDMAGPRSTRMEGNLDRQVAPSRGAHCHRLDGAGTLGFAHVASLQNGQGEWSSYKSSQNRRKRKTSKGVFLRMVFYLVATSVSLYNDADYIRYTF